MKKLFLIITIFVSLIILSHSAFCQEEKKSEPFIVSIMPDSLLIEYDYSQTVFFTVSISGTFAKDPTEKAIEKLQKKIIKTCKQNKFDGFILNQMVFAKPAGEGKLIGYGTLLRKKKNHPKSSQQSK